MNLYRFEITWKSGNKTFEYYKHVSDQGAKDNALNYLTLTEAVHEIAVYRHIKTDICDRMSYVAAFVKPKKR